MPWADGPSRRFRSWRIRRKAIWRTWSEILKGGAEKMREADCAILGGHSVADDEIKFGYAVTGTVHPARVKANAGARAGDALVFTKRLGTGVISTALKRGIARDADVAASIASDADAESAGVRGDAGSTMCTAVRTSPASG